MRKEQRDEAWVSFNLKAYLRSKERDIILDYLNATNGNKTRAARLLHMSRPSLIYRMKILGLSHLIEFKNMSTN